MTRRFNQAVILALLLLFTFSELSLIRETLGCTVSSLLPLWISAFCLSTWFTTCSRRGLWIGIPLSLVLLYGAYRYYHTDLLLLFSDFFDRITGVYMEQIAVPGSSYVFTGKAADHSLIFVLLAFLFSSYISSAITARSGRLFLSLLGGLPFTLACLAVNRRPSVLPVIGLVLFFLLLAAGGSHYDEDSVSYRSVLFTLLPLGLLLGALVLIVRPSQYQYDPSQALLTQEIRRFSDALDTWISERAADIVLPHAERTVEYEAEEQDGGNSESEETAFGSPRSEPGPLDLTRSIEPEELDRSILRIQADHTGTLYLRSSSYGDYAGTSWLQAESIPEPSSLVFTAKALEAAGSVSHRVRVRAQGELPALCLPYFSTKAGSDDRFVPAEQTSYSSFYYLFPESFEALTVPGSLLEDEAEYRRYAYDYYTRLPTGTLDALLILAQQAGLNSETPDLIGAVARYVCNGAVYDLEVGQLPGSDYALSFLTDVHRGYCVHFATAAAALYRALGIPARVTDGYLIYAVSGQEIEVKGSDAHAWVEVYRDGLGWLPVEVTGQSGLQSDFPGVENLEPESPQPEEPVNEGSPEVDGTPQESALSPLPDGSADTAVGLVTQSLEEEIGETVGRAAKQSRTSFLAAVLAIILFLALFPACRLLQKLFRRWRFNQADRNRAAVAVYRAARRAAAFGGHIPPEIQRCAEKAVFSSHPVTEEELSCCRGDLTKMLEALYQDLNVWKKFVFKYLHGFL